MLPTSGMPFAGEIDTLTVSPAFSRALIAFDSDCWITSVGAKLSPPPKEKLTASPGATRPISTPIAPLSTA